MGLDFFIFASVLLGEVSGEGEECGKRPGVGILPIVAWEKNIAFIAKQQWGLQT